MSSLQDPLLSGPTDELEDGSFEFDQVLREERECIDKKLRVLRELEQEEPGVPFSLAFSGGGIRAAAFQAGVLWRLAELNRLKDVEYFTAVSGGGYITSAFASHCLASAPPEPGQVRAWYRNVVAKTVTRMQANAGDFVRDCFSNPWYQEEGAGRLPRWCDLPVLLLTLGITLLVNPVTFVVVFVVPTVINIEFFYGAAMRAAFCAPPRSEHSWWSIFFMLSPFAHLIRVLAVLAIATMVVFLAKMLLPCCKLTARKDHKRPKASFGYLMGHAASGFLVRFTLATLGFVIFLFLVVLLQTHSYKETDRVQYCHDFIQNVSGMKQSCADISSALHKDINVPASGLWFESSIFETYGSVVEEVVNKSTAAVEDEEEKDIDRWIDLFKGIFDNRMLYNCFILWFLFLMFAICIMPIFGSKVLVDILIISGPLVIVVLLLAFTQYCVFGPITHNRDGMFPYKAGRWETFASESLIAAFIILPLYSELRASLHAYYKTCLQKNYFSGGKDVTFASIAEHPACPFVILTGTSSDFQPPGDHDVISELSFSALHTGSEETGYIKTPDYRSLAKCTALTGAGCLDAISLSMSETLWLRFFLEVLNLSWGDYILFQGKQNEFIANLTESLDVSLKGTLIRLLYRLPSGVIWLFAYVWFNIAWSHARTGATVESCRNSKELLFMASMVILTVFGLSFFSFVPGLQWLAASSMIRQFQQGTKYFYVGERPPPMLYVTDGGVKDCTALVQLMMRKCKRILLVLAAADPNDELAVLKAAMEVAKEHKIGSFYDPVDPRRDVSVMFEEYKKDRAIPYLHIGISYCWPESGEEMTSGHIYIVKNRLPPEYEGQPCQPHISEEEVRGEPVMTERSIPAEWEDLTTDQLGPFGCCDCCHTRGLNCGPKFPHGSFTGYMYLSPQWCNSLTRLGYALSEQAVQKLTGTGELRASWEAGI